jgi:oligopeptide/dipeptide ABC transporter ATP-binding protein
MSEPLLEVDNLTVTFPTEEGPAHAVRGVSFDLAPGEILALVGESGSGKSVTVSSLMGLTRGSGARFEGTARLGDTELIGADDETLRKLRGAQMAMVFQDPMTSLNPVQRVGHQIVEMIRAHEDVSKQEARARTIDLLRSVGVPEPDKRVDAYPHEFSGGMRQRAMIAMALACSPRVLFADEPTTALDVTIQAQILDLLRKLADERGAGIVLVTHDLGVVAKVADRVAVMYAGRIVETGTLDELFYDPLHPYTWGLLGSIPRVDTRAGRLTGIPGSLPSVHGIGKGCGFAPRCPHAFDRCRSEEPQLEPRAGVDGHPDRCFLPLEDKRARRDQAGRIGLFAAQDEEAA